MGSFTHFLSQYIEATYCITDSFALFRKRSRRDLRRSMGICEAILEVLPTCQTRWI